MAVWLWAVLALVGAGVAFAMTMCRPKAKRFRKAMKRSAAGRVVPNTNTNNGTPAYKCEVPLDSPPAGVTTLYDSFLNGKRVAGDSAPCFGERPIIGGVAHPYTWYNYGQIFARVEAFGSGIEKLDLSPVVPGSGCTDAFGAQLKDMRFMGLYSRNMMEWNIAAQACNRQGVVVVPLYDTLGPDTVKYVLRQTGMSTIVCSPREVSNVLDAASSVATLTTIVVMKTPDAAADEKFRAQWRPLSKVRILSFAEVEAAGKAAPVPRATCTKDDVATFCYTSGTTGDPKGAMLSHDNILSDVFAVFTAGIRLNKGDVHLSYLPLAHMFERVVEEAVMHGGGSIGFFQGEATKILEDLATLRPTIFPSVPRLYNRMYDTIMSKSAAAGGIKAAMFKMAVAAKMKGLQAGYLEHPFWDMIVFGPAKKRMGLDRCRVMVTGSAPIASHVLEFLRLFFGCPVCEGYGQTECGAAATLSLPDDYSTGHVGGPLAVNQVKLVDVPELGYLHTDTAHGDQPCKGRGEVCFKGRNVFRGYYKMADKTAEAVDADGWLHSGDIGIWTTRNELRIVDRKKNIFKLSQGEYVAAEKIENVLTGRCDMVAQCFVYGDSMHSYLVGIVVPDAHTLTAWAKANGQSATDMHSLCASGEVKKMILAQIQSTSKAHGLHGFETLRDIHLESEMWTADNGILTPTFKLKRKEAQTKYQAQIDAMYKADAVGGRTDVRQH